jgi:two-component system nitrate/nitrite response regulator NarL
MLTILVITDQPLVEAGLRTLLQDSPDLHLDGVVRTFAELREATAASKPAVVLAALRGEDDAPLQELRFAGPGCPVVIIGREFSPEYAHRALELGIRGLISSAADPDSLRDCLRKTAHGELWMDNALSMLLLDTHPIRLSKRQAELIHLLSQGLKNKEIADILGISEGTVKAYLTTLFEKVGAKDRFELALFGLKHHGALNNDQILVSGRRRAVRSLVARPHTKYSVA